MCGVESRSVNNSGLSGSSHGIAAALLQREKERAIVCERGGRSQSWEWIWPTFLNTSFVSTYLLSFPLKYKFHFCLKLLPLPCMYCWHINLLSEERTISANFFILDVIYLWFQPFVTVLLFILPSLPNMISLKWADKDFNDCMCKNPCPHSLQKYCSACD